MTLQRIFCKCSSCHKAARAFCSWAVLFLKISGCFVTSWNKTPGKQLNSYRASLSLISSLHNKNLTYIVQTFVGRSGVRAEGDFQTWALRALIACCAAGPTPTDTACFSSTATAQPEDSSKIVPCPKHCCWGSGRKARGWAKLLHMLLGPSDLPLCQVSAWSPAVLRGLRHGLKRPKFQQEGRNLTILLPGPCPSPTQSCAST